MSLTGGDAGGGSVGVSAVMPLEAGWDGGSGCAVSVSPAGNGSAPATVYEEKALVMRLEKVLAATGTGKRTRFAPLDESDVVVIGDNDPTPKELLFSEQNYALSSAPERGILTTATNSKRSYVGSGGGGGRGGTHTSSGGGSGEVRKRARRGGSGGLGMVEAKETMTRHALEHQRSVELQAMMLRIVEAHRDDVLAHLQVQTRDNVVLVKQLKTLRENHVGVELRDPTVDQERGAATAIAMQRLREETAAMRKHLTSATDEITELTSRCEVSARRELGLAWVVVTQQEQYTRSTLVLQERYIREAAVSGFHAAVAELRHAEREQQSHASFIATEQQTRTWMLENQREVYVKEASDAKDADLLKRKVEESCNTLIAASRESLLKSQHLREMELERSERLLEREQAAAEAGVKDAEILSLRREIVALQDERRSGMVAVETAHAQLAMEQRELVAAEETARRYAVDAAEATSRGVLASGIAMQLSQLARLHADKRTAGERRRAEAAEARLATAAAEARQTIHKLEVHADMLRDSLTVKDTERKCEVGMLRDHIKKIEEAHTNALRQQEGELTVWRLHAMDGVNALAACEVACREQVGLEERAYRVEFDAEKRIFEEIMAKDRAEEAMKKMEAKMREATQHAQARDTINARLRQRLQEAETSSAAKVHELRESCDDFASRNTQLAADKGRMMNKIAMAEAKAEWASARAKAQHHDPYEYGDAAELRKEIVQLHEEIEKLRQKPATAVVEQQTEPPAVVGVATQVAADVVYAATQTATEALKVGTAQTDPDERPPPYTPVLFPTESQRVACLEAAPLMSMMPPQPLQQPPMSVSSLPLSLPVSPNVAPPSVPLPLPAAAATLQPLKLASGATALQPPLLTVPVTSVGLSVRSDTDLSGTTTTAPAGGSFSTVHVNSPGAGEGGVGVLTPAAGAAMGALPPLPAAAVPVATTAQGHSPTNSAGGQSVGSAGAVRVLSVDTATAAARPVSPGVGSSPVSATGASTQSASDDGGKRKEKKGKKEKKEKKDKEKAKKDKKDKKKDKKDKKDKAGSAAADTHAGGAGGGDASGPRPPRHGPINLGGFAAMVVQRTLTTAKYHMSADPLGATQEPGPGQGEASMPMPPPPTHQHQQPSLPTAAAPPPPPSAPAPQAPAVAAAAPPPPQPAATTAPTPAAPVVPPTLSATPVVPIDYEAGETDWEDNQRTVAFDLAAKQPLGLTFSLKEFNRVDGVATGGQAKAKGITFGMHVCSINGFAINSREEFDIWMEELMAGAGIVRVGFDRAALVKPVAAVAVASPKAAAPAPTTAAAAAAAAPASPPAAGTKPKPGAKRVVRKVVAKKASAGPKPDAGATATPPTLPRPAAKKISTRHDFDSSCDDVSEVSADERPAAAVPPPPSPPSSPPPRPPQRRRGSDDSDTDSLLSAKPTMRHVRRNSFDDDSD